MTTRRRALVAELGWMLDSFDVMPAPIGNYTEDDSACRRLASAAAPFVVGPLAQTLASTWRFRPHPWRSCSRP